MEKQIEIHDENGFVELQTIVVEEPIQIQSTEDLISQKEQQLLQIYAELQVLKEKQ